MGKDYHAEYELGQTVFVGEERQEATVTEITFSKLIESPLYRCLLKGTPKSSVLEEVDVYPTKD